MKLTVEIDGKSALPVRAIAYASGDPCELIHPGMVPQILAGDAGDPENPDEIPRAFRVGLGGFDRVEPEFWSLYRDNFRQLKKQRETNGLASIEYFRSCLQLLPSDLFVWFDEFNEWQGRTLALVRYNPAFYPKAMRIDGWSRWDDPVAVRRPQLRAEAFVPTEFEQFVTEGLQSFAGSKLAYVEAKHTDNLAPPTKEEASPTQPKRRGPKPSNAPALLGQILDALKSYAAATGQDFDRERMPGPLGESFEDEGSFHWLCAQLYPSAFNRAPDTFTKHRAGLCALAPYAKPTIFYRLALPHIAPKLGAKLNVHHMPKKGGEAA